MNIEEAINWLKQISDRYIRGGDEAYDEKRKEALDMAISALRAQQTPLDRSRWRKCWGGNFSERFYKYLPECGRPQTEYAWAELERRINGGTTD